MSDPTEAISHKYGPLPGWAWIVVVAGGAWGFYWFRNKRVSTTPAQQATDNGLSSSASSIPNSPYPVASSDPGLTTGELGLPAVSSLTQWTRTASNALLAEGNDPLTVQNALSNYTSGVQLSAPQQAIVSLALQKFGTPPGGTIPTATIDPNHLYKVNAGDTVQSVAERYYGNSNPNTLRIIQAANPDVVKWNGTAYDNLSMGQTIQLTPNGIAGVQNNTLNV